MKTKRIPSVVFFMFMLSAATANAISLDFVYNVQADSLITTPLDASFENTRLKKDFRFDLVNRALSPTVAFPADYTGDRFLSGDTVNWRPGDNHRMDFQGKAPHKGDWGIVHTVTTIHAQGIAGGGLGHHIAPIPEPSVLLLIAVGLVILSSKQIRKLMNK